MHRLGKAVQVGGIIEIGQNIRRASDGDEVGTCRLGGVQVQGRPSEQQQAQRMHVVHAIYVHVPTHNSMQAVRQAQSLIGQARFKQVAGSFLKVFVC
jgi:hypothetical protein